MQIFALDRNGDGFLTARELDDPPKPVSTATAGVAPGAAPRSVPGAVPVTPATAAAPVVNNDSPEVRRAKYFFSITDKDKNGEISAEEWAASRGIRGMFEKANITAVFPLKEAVFVEQFQSLQTKSAS